MYLSNRSFLSHKVEYVWLLSLYTTSLDMSHALNHVKSMWHTYEMNINKEASHHILFLKTT